MRYVLDAEADWAEKLELELIEIVTDDALVASLTTAVSVER